MDTPPTNKPETRQKPRTPTQQLVGEKQYGVAGPVGRPVVSGVSLWGLWHQKNRDLSRHENRLTHARKTQRPTQSRNPRNFIWPSSSPAHAFRTKANSKDRQNRQTDKQTATRRYKVHGNSSDVELLPRGRPRGGGWTDTPPTGVVLAFWAWVHPAIAFAIASEFCRKRPFARNFRIENDILVTSFAKPFAITSELIRNA